MEMPAHLVIAAGRTLSTARSPSPSRRRASRATAHRAGQPKTTARGTATRTASKAARTPRGAGAESISGPPCCSERNCTEGILAQPIGDSTRKTSESVFESDLRYHRDGAASPRFAGLTASSLMWPCVRGGALHHAEPAGDGRPPRWPAGQKVMATASQGESSSGLKQSRRVFTDLVFIGEVKAIAFLFPSGRSTRRDSAAHESRGRRRTPTPLRKPRRRSTAFDCICRPRSAAPCRCSPRSETRRVYCHLLPGFDEKLAERLEKVFA
jgi:hypothetical protein